MTTAKLARANRLAAALGEPLPNGSAKGKPKAEQMAIAPLRQRTIAVLLTGTAPYMQARFSEKALAKMLATQEAGQQARGKKVREARKTDDDYEAATHFLQDGTCGIPATAFRNACISACRCVGFAMTKAKLSVFIEPDGFDRVDSSPLVRIYGLREKTIMPARNDNGSCDLRVRPKWDPGWTAILRVRFDEDQFATQDVMNLLNRAGCQVGVGEGRPDSRKSNGMGYGLFDISPVPDSEIAKITAGLGAHAKAKAKKPAKARKGK